MLTQPVSDVNRSDRSADPGYVDFEVSTSHADGVAIVQVTGDLDCYTAPQLRAALLGWSPKVRIR